MPDDPVREISVHVPAQMADRIAQMASRLGRRRPRREYHRWTTRQENVSFHLKMNPHKA